MKGIQSGINVNQSLDDLKRQLNIEMRNQELSERLPHPENINIDVAEKILKTARDEGWSERDINDFNAMLERGATDKSLREAYPEIFPE
jgi:hypothetical protein